MTPEAPKDIFILSLCRARNDLNSRQPVDLGFRWDFSQNREKGGPKLFWFHRGWEGNWPLNGPKDADQNAGFSGHSSFRTAQNATTPKRHRKTNFEQGTQESGPPPPKIPLNKGLFGAI